jgi:hypothetical protein
MWKLTPPLAFEVYGFRQKLLRQPNYTLIRILSYTFLYNFSIVFY